MLGSLAGAAVYHGDEVICDDQSVLASLLALLAYDILFYNLHIANIRYYLHLDYFLP